MTNILDTRLSDAKREGCCEWRWRVFRHSAIYDLLLARESVEKFYLWLLRALRLSRRDGRTGDVIYQVSQTDRPQIGERRGPPLTLRTSNRHVQRGAIRFPTLLQIANGRPTTRSRSGSELVKYDLFYVLNVPAHGRFRGFPIVAFDGGQNPPMSSERFLWPTLHLQRAFPRVAQQVHDDVQHFQHDAIPRSQSNAVMEFRVFSDRAFASNLFFFLAFQNFFHLSNFIGGGVRGGARC